MEYSDNTDSTDSNDDLSEVIKLREELSFSQLEPYDSDITHILLKHSNTNANMKEKHKYPKFTIHKKEIHNESIGDEYDEYFTTDQLMNQSYTKFKVLDTNHTKTKIPTDEDCNLVTLKKYITPNMTDLNISNMLDLTPQKFTYLLSYLYFGVYWEDPDLLSINPLDINTFFKEDFKGKLEFFLKYFKYRIKSLDDEYIQNKIVVDDDDIDVDLYTKKILPLLLMLRDNIQNDLG
ncbi:uncharacterized protein HGUI_00480 [Hanseniaspora guilliermondii]|uniref:Uncharacterized protein n=1 Tax=Hanseniaspora guilliermondii TaxID=56406 RepID=A0A1L0AVZ2_9ASCO|nr:uncharacterized protein HGUI_00480 [Hanseniaspora guilliermondii]